MCSSCSSVSRWMERPINLSDEKCTLLAISGIALLIIGAGAVSYFYGAGSYNHFCAYLAWGLAGCTILGTTIVYIARDIISKGRSEPVIDEWQPALSCFEENFKRDKNYQKFFPVDKKVDYIDESVDTSYSARRHAVAPIICSSSKNIARVIPKQGLPFLGVRLSIRDGYTQLSEVLIIGPDSSGNWRVDVDNCIKQHICEDIQTATNASLTFLHWLDSILKGEERYLLWPTKGESGEFRLHEDRRGPKVSLWRN